MLGLGLALSITGLSHLPLYISDVQARIALLEGQRRSAENLKVDLLRRVKMLEFALRQERHVDCSEGTTDKQDEISRNGG